jgi:hypothetical protein
VDARSSLLIKVGAIGAVAIASYVGARIHSGSGLPGRTATAVETGQLPSAAGGASKADRGSTIPGAAVSEVPFAPVQEPIRLPRLGSLDQRALEGGHILRGLRSVVADRIAPVVAERCRALHTNGDTVVSVAVSAVIARGSISLTRMADVAVEHGAPITAALETCIHGLPLPISVPDPVVRAPGTGQSRPGRWSLPDQTGEFVVRLSFRDSCR